MQIYIYTMLNIHVYTVGYCRRVEESVRRNNLYTFGFFEIRLTPQWECTIVQRTSPFILIAAAHRSASPSVPGRDSNRGPDLGQAGALTKLPRTPNELRHTPNELCPTPDNLDELRHTTPLMSYDTPIKSYATPLS